MSDWTACPNCGAEVRGEWRNLDGPWDGPEEQRPHTVPLWDRHDCHGTFDTGAAVAFGIVGMGMAIRMRYIEDCLECHAEQCEPDMGRYLCDRCA